MTPPKSYLAAAAALTGLLASASPASAQTTPTAPYRILNTSQTMGSGGIDYVFADSAERRLYIPRGEAVLVFDLDTLKSVGTIANARARGVAVDPKSHHGFCSSSPVVMWDTKTLATIKTIPVQGRPDGILFEPLTERVYVFSHSQPNATVIDAKDGSVIDTIDLGGAPEQAASDGRGHLYVDIEDKDNVAVVDVNTLKVSAHYDLAAKGAAPPAWAWMRRTTSFSPSAMIPQPLSSSAATMGKSWPPCPSAGVRTAAGSTPKRWKPSVHRATEP